jgi:predicted transcriptional regulator
MSSVMQPRPNAMGSKTKDITLYPIGGVARLEKMPEKPSQELIVALAGPFVNVVIMVLLLPFIYGFEMQAEVTEKGLIIGSSNFLPMLGIVNIWLALFNLIPAFPMDGGRVLRALLAMKTTRVKATDIAATIGKILAVGFIITGFYLNPFLIFIGIFIILGAHAEAEMVKTQFFITDLTAADALMTHYRSLEKDQPIGDAVKLLLDGTAKSFVITHQGVPFGTLGRDQIIRGIKEFGEDAVVERVTEKHIVSVDRHTSLNDVFSKFQQSRTPIILVKSATGIEGIIDADNIAELILVKSARGNSN